MLLVGLGNPESKYKHNRHNVGFMAVDEIIRRHEFVAVGDKFGGIVSVGEIGGHKVYTIKPLTYMNESGVSVAKIARFYKIPLEDIYVFYDDLDLPVAKVKTKIGGGDGGHNGIKSIDEHLGKAYNRVRIGIDHPGHKDKVHSYVLGDFKPKERVEIDIILQHIAENVAVLINGSGADFTTKLALVCHPHQAIAKMVIQKNKEETRFPALQAENDKNSQ